MVGYLLALAAVTEIRAVSPCVMFCLEVPILRSSVKHCTAWQRSRPVLQMAKVPPSATMRTGRLYSNDRCLPPDTRCEQVPLIRARHRAKRSGTHCLSNWISAPPCLSWSRSNSESASDCEKINSALTTSARNSVSLEATTGMAGWPVP